MFQADLTNYNHIYLSNSLNRIRAIARQLLM